VKNVVLLALALPVLDVQQCQIEQRRRTTHKPGSLRIERYQRDITTARFPLFVNSPRCAAVITFIATVDFYLARHNMANLLNFGLPEVIAINNDNLFHA
jgi:hypothetical protein